MRHRVPPAVGRSAQTIRQAVGLALAVGLMTGLGGCGGSGGGDDPESTGVRDRALEQLREYGLPEDQAACVVDAMGAETVAATQDMEVLAAGQEYRDAVESCPS